MKNNISIAHIGLKIIASETDCNASVVSHAPGDGAAKIISHVASGVGMEACEIDMMEHEYHSGAIAALMEGEVDPSIAKGRAVIFILTRSHEAPTGLIAAVARNISARTNDQTLKMVAITTSAGEKRVAKALAMGLDVAEGRVESYRTQDENLRIAEKFLKANAQLKPE